MAPMRGFEPPTYRLGGGRSILLSYMGIALYNFIQNLPNVNILIANRVIMSEDNGEVLPCLN